MADTNDAETILIVDDEEPIRRTFREWLAGLGCRILAAADAEEALRIANQEAVDLALLDWHLGAGDDGLQLLQDLVAFHPDVVAIMVTGYANQATPLDAMRMGVRDYLDKNQDLTRDTLVRAVNKQLDLIRPARRARKIHQSLVAFQEAVEKILPLVQSAAALNDPVPLPDAARGLLRFLMQTTGAEEGVLLARHYDAARQPPESYRAYSADGRSVDEPLAPFARSLAATVISMGEARVISTLDPAQAELQPFERGRRNALLAPLAVGGGVQAVIELLDKRGGAFTAQDQRLAQAAADLGTELLRQALGQRQTQQLLLDAIGAALGAGDQVAQSLQGSAPERLEAPPPTQVLEQLRQGLSAAAGDSASAEASVRLAEAIRVLALRHGTPALEHCLRLVENVRGLLDRVTSE